MRTTYAVEARFGPPRRANWSLIGDRLTWREARCEVEKCFMENETPDQVVMVNEITGKVTYRYEQSYESNQQLFATKRV